MAQFSSEEEAFIHDHPLAPRLEPLRSVTQDKDAETNDASLEDTRNAISDILSALMLHPVAKKLQSTLPRPLNSHIASLYGRLQVDDFDLTPFEPLHTAVATKAPDLEVWKLVLQVVDTFTRITPPPPPNKIVNTFNGTPRTVSSASFQDSLQRRRDLEQPVRRELANCTFEDIPEFFKHYFEDTKWSDKASEICQELRKANGGDLLKGFPEKHEEDGIWAWLDQFQAAYLTKSPNRYRRTTSKGQTLTEAERQLDLVVQPRKVSVTKVLDMSHVQVVGELTSSAKSQRWLEKFIQVAVYIRDVFASQPVRRYVHAFLIFQNEMQLWVFDRSGAYSSTTFGIFEEPERFIHVIVGYTLMTEEELGHDTFIQRNSIYTTISVEDATTGEDSVIQLLPKPFGFQRSIVSRATSCYQSLDRKHVIKFSWRPAERKAEPEYLRAAKGIGGVAQLKGSRDITSIRHLRQGLTFTRKSARNIPLLGPRYRSLLTSQSAKSSGNLGNSGSKRGSTEQGDRDPKRSRRSSLRTESWPDDEPSHSSRILDPPPLFRSRILTCVVISPMGRPLREFESVEELLTGLRDAIRGHKALYMERKILHRDISVNNIILTDRKEHGHAGALIDLDLAVMVDHNGKNEQSDAPAMTGTLEFMALEILKGGLGPKTAGIEHTYRHDLESFFYVLIAVCTRYGWGEQPPQFDPLEAWYTGPIKDIYGNKRGSVEPGGFEDLVLAYFSPTFAQLKPLARELRDILFSRGAVRTGTDKDPQRLYSEIIASYDKAIQAIQARSYYWWRVATDSQEQTAQLKRKRSTSDCSARKRKNTCNNMSDSGLVSL